MNETVGYVRVDNETGTKEFIVLYEPFFQIAEYLSDRGFVTLRYDKRLNADEINLVNVTFLIYTRRLGNISYR